MKKSRDSRKFGTKNRDCPSKIGTVGTYGLVKYMIVLYVIYVHVMTVE